MSVPKRFLSSPGVLLVSVVCSVLFFFCVLYKRKSFVLCVYGLSCKWWWWCGGGGGSGGGGQWIWYIVVFQCRLG